MDCDSETLNRVLRAQLTAVHQQFVHVLALRHWGLEETAHKVMEIDNVDFPLAMKIIDHLIGSGQPLDLEADHFTPGACEAEILAAEMALEQRFRAILESAEISTAPGADWIAAALAPRQSYAGWLSERVRQCERQGRARASVVDDLAQPFSHLIVMIEQAMVHAFVHWHRGDKADANSAWATSGAAMMHATGIVRWLAARGTTPAPAAVPSLKISDRPDMAFELDRRLASALENCMSRLAGDQSSELRDLCRPIADYAGRLANWKPDQEHPAKDTNPPAFRSFEATLAKFVWS